MINPLRKTILKGTGILILVTLLFPPLRYTNPYHGGSAGYGSIFLDHGERIGTDALALLIQWAGIILLAAIAWILTSGFPAGQEHLIQKTENQKLDLARKYESGDISFIDLEKQKLELDRAVRSQIGRWR